MLKMVHDQGNGSRSKQITILLHISILKQNNIHDEKQSKFYRFIYFSKSCGKMLTANCFISMVKAGRKLATPPYLLIALSSPDLP